MSFWFRLILWKLFKPAWMKPPLKEQKNLQAVSVTTPNGITRVNLEALFKAPGFLQNAAELEKLARRVIPSTPQSGR